MPEPSKNYTYKLDDLTNTRLEWLVLFSKELGVPKATKRIVLTRAIEVYLECMEDTATLHRMSHRHREVIQERTALLKASIAQESYWDSSQIPDVETEVNGVFQTYTNLITPKVNHKTPGIPKWMRKADHLL